VIVESPAKAKTLKKLFGRNYKIEASVGHVRDLPKSRLGIIIKDDSETKPEDNFIMEYINIRGKKEIIDKLKLESKKADKIYLATDPDREGEAIAWHLYELLKLDSKNTKRITFNEITKVAVENSLDNARDINMNLVDAQQARRALDRIVGYKISPILWHKIRGGLSAGRVQSVELKIICDREKERENFVSEEYWTIEAILKFKSDVRELKANFFGEREDKKEKKLKSEDETKIIIDFINLNKEKFLVEEIKKSSRIKKPNPPFITSTLQQEASKNLAFTTDKTMRIAQELYEGIKIEKEIIGLISYIRTDSVRISDEAYEQAKEFILNTYGEKYLPKKRVIYKSKKNIQDAHEAIRPTYVNKLPDDLKSFLSMDQYKLYKLIWQRFIASQMSNATYDTQVIKVSCEKYIFKILGSVLKFDGYLIIYNIELDSDVDIPNLNVGDKLNLIKIKNEQHFTQPPSRFTEASLIKTLEESGVGRPSTYSAIITNIQRRGYVKKENKNFYPVELGKIVNKLLEDNFNQIVNINFTSNMESSLDKI
jgi:DNA topoisomerase-1